MQTITALKARLPPLRWLPLTTRHSLLADTIAGLTVAILGIPQSLAYAKLAGLPPQFGIYALVVGLVSYSLLSTSRATSVGPTAVLSQLCGQVISQAKPSNIVAYAASLSLISGILSFLVGIFKIKAVTDVVSKAVVLGFTTGAAMSIISTQLASILGISISIDPSTPPILVLVKTLIAIPTASFDASLGISTIVFLTIWRVSAIKLASMKKVLVSKWIGHLANAVALVLFSSVAYMVNQGQSGRVKTIGVVALKVPSPGLPGMQWADLGVLVPTSLTIMLVSVLEHTSITRSFEKKTGVGVKKVLLKLDGNQEVLALGVTNILGSLLGVAIPVTGSFSRSAVNFTSGAQSPLSGLIAALIVIIGAYSLSAYLQHIPTSTLAAVISFSVLRLITPLDRVWQMFRSDKGDFCVFVVAVIGALCSSVETGVYCALCLSLGVVLWRIGRPHLNVYEKIVDLDTSVQFAIDGDQDESGGLIDEPSESVSSDTESHIVAVIVGKSIPRVLVVELCSCMIFLNSRFIFDTITRQLTEHCKSELGIENSAGLGDSIVVELDFVCSRMDASGRECLIDLQLWLQDNKMILANQDIFTAVLANQDIFTAASKCR